MPALDPKLLECLPCLGIDLAGLFPAEAITDEIMTQISEAFSGFLTGSIETIKEALGLKYDGASTSLLAKINEKASQVAKLVEYGATYAATILQLITEAIELVKFTFLICILKAQLSYTW